MLSFDYRCDDDRNLHSFPTRRSSDLAEAGERVDEADVRTFRRLNRADTAVVRRVDVADLEARALAGEAARPESRDARSEEHTSELQSRRELVCRLLLEKKKRLRHKI